MRRMSVSVSHTASTTAYVTCYAPPGNSPNGESKVARVGLGGPGQEGALDASLLQQHLRLQARDVGVKPSVERS